MTHKRYIPICWYCKHFDNDAWNRNFHIRKCIAFDEAIPDEIWAEYYNHANPHPDDNGIQFEKAEKAQLLQRKAIRLIGFDENNIDQIDTAIERYLEILAFMSQENDKNK